MFVNEDLRIFFVEEGIKAQYTTAYPLRKFEQFPAQKMYQILRWPAQILARSPRWTSAIPALGRASLAPSAGEMDDWYPQQRWKDFVF